MDKKPKEQKAEKQTTIVDSDWIINLSEKAIFVKGETLTYVTSRKLFENLLHGTLITKGTKKKAKAIQLGVFEDEGINNKTKVFLTVKDKSVYFSPEKGKLLVSAISTLLKLCDGELNEVTLGLFQKE